MARWLHARQVVEEEWAAAQADKSSKKHHRFPEAYEALKWLLARHCSKLPVATRTVKGVQYHLYRQEGDELTVIPDITVLFTYDENRVNILALRAEKSRAVGFW